MTESDGPNAQQRSYWNEIAGPKWVQLDALINDQYRSALGARRCAPVLFS